MADWTLHVLIDPKQVPLDGVDNLCRALRDGGATVAQLRGKHSDGGELIRYGEAFRRATRDTGILFIVNDRVDIAMAVQADGVHVGQDDIPVEVVRRLAPNLIVGLSVGSEAELRVAERARPDYIGMGPVYPTPSKDDAGEALNVDGFRRLCLRAKRLAPVVAIGGIQPDNAKPVWESGADGIAVISAVMGAPDKRAACFALLASRG
ncbi:thiamine phosphate synthase [Sulfobacillus harzensis]|uniref:Thiamine-phosphate synthase n=1 Tax=Sulfobacillus harzensis TaxID=2729629 RepID=A0A7Y0Q460_9FIRM|nr:thiamine phosphate synthase [Sulfobacillus harzensis]NMP24287.1 thiamine phosphate synthase [Sulfobacillus harzensis]